MRYSHLWELTFDNEHNTTTSLFKGNNVIYNCLPCFPWLAFSDGLIVLFGLDKMFKGDHCCHCCSTVGASGLPSCLSSDTCGDSDRFMSGNGTKCTLFLRKVDVGVWTKYCRGLFVSPCTMPVSS